MQAWLPFGRTATRCACEQGAGQAQIDMARFDEASLMEDRAGGGKAAGKRPMLCSGRASGQCGTPGCRLLDFHDGPCTTQQVGGQRRSQAARQCAAESVGDEVTAADDDDEAEAEDDDDDDAAGGFQIASKLPSKAKGKAAAKVDAAPKKKAATAAVALAAADDDDEEEEDDDDEEQGRGGAKGKGGGGGKHASRQMLNRLPPRPWVPFPDYERRQPAKSKAAARLGLDGDLGLWRRILGADGEEEEEEVVEITLTPHKSQANRKHGGSGGGEHSRKRELADGVAGGVGAKRVRSREVAAECANSRDRGRQPVELDPFEAASRPSWMLQTAPSRGGGNGEKLATAAEIVMRASRQAAQISGWTLAAERGAGATEQEMIREAIKASVDDERERRKRSRAAMSDLK